MQRMQEPEFYIRNPSSPINVKRVTNLSTRDLFPGGFFYLSIVILLVSCGLIVLSQTVWDYDFWWHIATGRYIVQTGHIPVADPFSFTSQLPENSNLYPARERFILSQYWLAQVLMYLLYHNFGAAGIVFLRAVLLFGAMYIIYRALKSRGVLPYIAYLSLFLAVNNLFRFFGDRPVLFTISLSVVCFVIVDDYIRKRSRAFYFLPVLMLVWANLHGGFILGDVIIFVFMMTEVIKLFFGRSAFSDREKGIFFLVLFLSLGASGINPNGFLGFGIASSPEYAPFYKGIQEYRSPFSAYYNKMVSPDYGYLAALALFPVILFLRNKKFNPAHLLLLIFLAVESVTAGRFTVYYGIIASLVLGSELDQWLKEHQERFIFKQSHVNIVFSVIMLLSSVLYFIGKADPDVFHMRESRWIVPKNAADFIEKNHVQGNMLNDMGTGGYLSWRLYPEVKTFIDSRALNYTTMKEYSWMLTATESAYKKSLAPGKTPLWKRLIEHYGIKVVVISPMDIDGAAIPLVFKLLDESDWVPVSLDVMAMVFVKDVPENRDIIKRFRKTNDQVYNTMIIVASLPAQRNKGNPYYMESLGDIFERMGRRKDAIEAYEYALKRMPDNTRVTEKLNKERLEVKK